MEQVKDAIGKQSALFAELVGACSEAALRAKIEMFGGKASRGSMKACGREELGTLNLWAGMDAA